MSGTRERGRELCVRILIGYCTHVHITTRLFYAGECLAVTGRKGKPPRNENDEPVAQPLLYQTGDVIGMVLSFIEDSQTQKGPKEQEGTDKDKGTAIEHGGDRLEQIEDTRGVFFRRWAETVAPKRGQPTTKPTEVTGTLTFHKNGVVVEGARMEGIRPGVHFAMTVYNSSKARLRILPAGGL